MTVPFATPHAAAPIVFDRTEMNAIFRLYAQMVSAGVWKDYALDFLKDAAIFSVYRKHTEYPLYRIEKRPSLRKRQGAYAVIAPGGLVMRRGHELGQVLRVLEKKRLRPIGG